MRGSPYGTLRTSRRPTGPKSHKQVSPSRSLISEQKDDGETRQPSETIDLIQGCKDEMTTTLMKMALKLLKIDD